MDEKHIESVGPESTSRGDIETARAPAALKLHPQPTSDSLDPLNWSKLQKHTILAIVMFKYEFRGSLM